MLERSDEFAFGLGLWEDLGIDILGWFFDDVQPETA